MYSKCKSNAFLVHFFVSIQLHDIRFTKCNISCWIYSSKIGEMFILFYKTYIQNF